MHGVPREAKDAQEIRTMDQSTEEKGAGPEDDRRGHPDYDNNHPKDWVRGNNEDATSMPHYDKSKKFTS